MTQFFTSLSLILTLSSLPAVSSTAAVTCEPQQALFFPRLHEFSGVDEQNTTYSLVLADSDVSLASVFGKSFSIELWFRFQRPSELEEDPILVGNTGDWRLTTNRGFVIAKSKAAHGRGLTVNVGTGQVSAQEFWTANWTVYTRANVQDNAWHHVAVSFEMSASVPAMHVWIDGALDQSVLLQTRVSGRTTSIPSTRLASGNDLTVGDEDYPTGYFWSLTDTAIAELRVWDFAWNPTTLARTHADGTTSATTVTVSPGGYVAGAGPSYSDALGNERGLAVHVNGTSRIDPKWFSLRRIIRGATRHDAVAQPVASHARASLPPMLRTRCEVGSAPSLLPDCSVLSAAECAAQEGCLQQGTACVADECYALHPPGVVNYAARALCVQNNRCGFRSDLTKLPIEGRCFIDTTCYTKAVFNPPTVRPDICNTTTGCRGMDGRCGVDPKECSLFGANGNRTTCATAHFNDTVPASSRYSCRVRGSILGDQPMPADGCVVDYHECAQLTLSECVLNPHCRNTTVVVNGYSQNACVADTSNCAAQTSANPADCNSLPGCRYDAGARVCTVDRTPCNDAKDEYDCEKRPECRFSATKGTCLATAGACNALSHSQCRVNTACAAAARDFGDAALGGLACVDDAIDCVISAAVCSGHGCANTTVSADGVSVTTCRCHASHAKGFWAGTSCSRCATGYVGVLCNEPASFVDVFYSEGSDLQSRFHRGADLIRDDLASALGVPRTAVSLIPALTRAPVNETGIEVRPSTSEPVVGSIRYEFSVDASRTTAPSATAANFLEAHALHVARSRSIICGEPGNIVAIEDPSSGNNATYCPPRFFAAMNGEGSNLWWLLLLLLIPIICCLLICLLLICRRYRDGDGDAKEDGLSGQLEDLMLRGAGGLPEDNEHESFDTLGAVGGTGMGASGWSGTGTKQLIVDDMAPSQRTVGMGPPLDESAHVARLVADAMRSQRATVEAAADSVRRDIAADEAALRGTLQTAAAASAARMASNRPRSALAGSAAPPLTPVHHAPALTDVEHAQLAATVERLQRQVMMLNDEKRASEMALSGRVGDLQSSLRDAIGAQRAAEEAAAAAQHKLRATEQSRAADRRERDAAAAAAAAAARAHEDAMVRVQQLSGDVMAKQRALAKSQQEAQRHAASRSAAEEAAMAARAAAADAQERLAASDRARRSALRSAADLRLASDATAAAEARARAAAEAAAREAVAQRDAAARLSGALRDQEARARLDRQAAEQRDREAAAAAAGQRAAEMELARLRDRLTAAARERDLAFRLAQQAVGVANGAAGDHARASANALAAERLRQADAREGEARALLDRFARANGYGPASPQAPTPRRRSTSQGNGRRASSVGSAGGVRRGARGGGPLDMSAGSMNVEGSVPQWVERFVQREDDRACALDLQHSCREGEV